MRRDVLKGLGACAALGPVLAACARVPEQPALRFDSVPPVRLAVGSFTTEEQMQPVAMDFIDRRRSDGLINATREYLSNRYQAAGGVDVGRGVIEQASIVERIVPDNGSVLRKLSPVGPPRELLGTLAVRVAVADGAGAEKVYARAGVQLQRGIATASSVVDRDRQAQILARDLVVALDRALSSSIGQNLSAYLAAG